MRKEREVEDGRQVRKEQGYGRGKDVDRMRRKRTSVREMDSDKRRVGGREQDRDGSSREWRGMAAGSMDGERQGEGDGREHEVGMEWEQEMGIEKLIVDRKWQKNKSRDYRGNVAGVRIGQRVCGEGKLREWGW